MPVKIKIDFDSKKIAKCIRTGWEREAPPLLKREVIQSLERGVNPVNKGPSRLPEYSEGYKDDIRKGRVKGKGRIRPVNLKASGKLHRSAQVRPTGESGNIEFRWRDPLADIHNRLGAGKSKVIRRNLPRKDKTNEEFSRNIMRKLVALMDRIVAKCIK